MSQIIPVGQSIFERLEKGLKDIFQTNLLPFLNIQDVASYFISHKGSTGTPTLRNICQKTIFQYRPIMFRDMQLTRLEAQNLPLLLTINKNINHLDFSYSDITEERLEEIVRTYPHLRSLNLSGCENIRNIAMLSGLTQLHTLDLSRNDIQDLSHLRPLTKLRTLNLSANNIQDISHLRPLTKLQTLNLANTNIQDYSHLSPLAELRTLNLSYTNIQDISHLRPLAQLHTLNLSHTDIQDISHLSPLTQLHTLNLSQNKHIQDFSHLTFLTQLRTLDLSNTNIQDISHLSPLAQLHTLDLSDTNIQDISHLRPLAQLHTLDLARTKIQDISHLSLLTHLHTLDLRSTNLQDITPILHLIQRQSFEYSGPRIFKQQPAKKASAPSPLASKPIAESAAIQTPPAKKASKHPRPIRVLARLPAKQTHFTDVIHFVLDQTEIKIMAIVLATIFRGAVGGFTALAAVGAYTYYRRRWTAV